MALIYDDVETVTTGRLRSMSDEASYIVKRRDIAEIIQNPDKDAIEELLEDPAAVLAASLTEVFTAPTAYVQRGVRIVQAAFKGEVFHQLGKEVRMLRKKGKLAKDFEKNRYGYQTWVELLTVIDEDIPDQDRLEALKAMFLACNKVNTTDAEHILGYQLFQIAKRLGSNELLVLKVVYELYKKGQIGEGNPLQNSGVGYTRWSEIVAEHLGHNLKSLVQFANGPLENHQLLSGHGTESIDVTSGRLTDLGIRFCQNIEQYQIEKKAFEL